ncbi:MAG: hypothetical protein EPO07_13960 [Verrucomicrobia bacterium]|nr:MAG: hypothetical protein EPO07_13960 [Verrucomicrobiota bacterium]
MESPGKVFSRRFLWIWAAVLVMAVAAIWFANIKTTTPTPARVVISADSNGTPRLLGVSLANTNVRDGVFQAMGVAGLKVATRMPAGFSPTNQTQVSNFVETLKALNRAGLFSTNSAPNLYE